MGAAAGLILGMLRLVVGAVGVTPQDLARVTTVAERVRTRTASARTSSTLEGFYIALTPTTSGPPVPVGHYFSQGLEAETDLVLAWSCYTPWVNLTGQPAVQLPLHLDSDGLPYSHDAELLALATQLERAALWNDVHPPCWDQRKAAPPVVKWCHSGGRSGGRQLLTNPASRGPAL